MGFVVALNCYGRIWSAETARGVGARCGLTAAYLAILWGFCWLHEGYVMPRVVQRLRARFRDVTEADSHPLYASPTIVTWSCKGHTGPAPACAPPPVPEDVPDEVIRVSASPRNKVLSAVLEGSNESTSKSGSGL